MRFSTYKTRTKSVFQTLTFIIGGIGCMNISAAQGTVGQYPEASKTGGEIRVVGHHFTRDGVKWTPHGLNFIAFVQPPAAQPGGCDGKTSTEFQTAWNRHQREGTRLFTGLARWGADSIRFQVSQQGLDSQSRIYSKVFFDSFVAAVRAARTEGLSVIVSIQDECQSGDPTTADYPGSENARVWTALAPLFKDDLGIMFEIYNEPEPGPSPENWRTWQAHFNYEIANIRASGAMNVVIADGLAFATSLHGAPTLTDPIEQLAYAVHPYFHRPDLTPAFWERKFGIFAARHLVVVTEWTTVANAPKSSTYYCDSNTPEQAVSLMKYLQNHDIGMLGFAWDFTGGKFGSVVYCPNNNSPSFVNSTYSGNSCGQVGFGPGNTMQSWFETGIVPADPQ